MSKTEINLRRLLSVAPNQQNQSKLIHYVATLRELLEQLSLEKTTPQCLPSVTKASQVNEYYEKIEAIVVQVPDAEVPDEPFANDFTNESSPKIGDDFPSPTSPQLRRRLVSTSSKPIKLDSAAQAHTDKQRKLQEDLTDEMVGLARQLKETSQAISQSVQTTEKEGNWKSDDCSRPQDWPVFKTIDSL
ncbi:PREDICTED: uncharacterized protein LOC104760873 isoform X2 [Camelina sativa]|nr:PREDICTED: uncharacterized protein LOC104760873 isoform X2 [Camelina sativa]XP_010482162.1 PREDICTED: uncharacterized protein LOC104760873 isoform X2 [Camelina sativa]XP_010482163.1 PREDICTED: uncharacterized protein LOC104760873 isoform X2 [Camelina sativa]XP_010482164.1 PREDICTED: uncharacterized protein LOC104760873 isoform X2 [Camelina sativa]XP_010482165.1 PREDICTED: uncharacterized protein LOC104760873 isoform X2 [Camelina sativa]XP_010482166.1 PREDICTED: uncharacterized protein LOC10